MDEKKFDVELRPNKWREYEGVQELIMIRNGKEIDEAQDGGEPEDNLFMRDWYWVPKWIMQAYEFGLEDGRKEAKND